MRQTTSHTFLQISDFSWILPRPLKVLRRATCCTRAANYPPLLYAKHLSSAKCIRTSKGIVMSHTLTPCVGRNAEVILDSALYDVCFYFNKL